MKEFEYTISEALFGGLKQGVEVPINSNTLDRCFNLEPTPLGPIPHSFIIDIASISESEICGGWTSFVSTTGDWTSCWPWPQLRKLENGGLIGIALVYGTENLGIFSLVTNEGSLVATLKATIGNVLEVVGVDISEHYGYLLIGVHYTDNSIASWLTGVGLEVGSIVPVDMDLMPEFIASTIFKGQVILGGLSGKVGSVWEGLGKSSICWGGVGKMEFDPTTDKTSGWIPKIDCGGTIVKVHSFGEKVVVFSTDGICILTPNEAGYSCDDLHMVGVATSRHVAGSDKVLGFVDNNFNFWMMKDSGEIKKLGYKHLIKPSEFASYYDELVRINVSFESSNGRFYIGNGIQCFVYNQFQMYETNQIASSVFAISDGTLVGSVINSSDTYGELITSITDFNQRGMQTVGFVEFGGHLTRLAETMATVSIGADYSYNMSEDFISAPYVQVGPEGVAYLGVTSSEFKFRVKISDYRKHNLSLKYLKARVKLVDKRYIRGLTDVNYAGRGSGGRVLGSD